MISVIIYTLNDEQTIEWCLDSLTAQHSKAGFEVVVIDDGSSDRTAKIVAQRFPQFRLVKEDRTRGWVASLRRHLPSFQGDLLAFLGAHCRAHRGWLAAIEEEMAKSYEVITGMGYHGKHRLLERFEAISIHGDYIGQLEGEVKFVWDDNFAIRPALLKEALPQTDVVLSDGAGATLLSLRLQNMGIPIRYRPSVKIDHVTHSLGRVIEMWYGELAENAIAIKLADPSLPGARHLWLGPIMAAALTANRLRQGIVAILHARDSLPISLLEVGFDICLLVCLLPVYFLGLCKHLFLAREQIRQSL